MNGAIARLGPIMQLAYVPGDTDAALAFWTQVMGAGPFFRMAHIGYKSARYRSEDSKVDFSVLIGYWGDMQIELIEQHCDSPSIYKSWLDEGREGLHHVCLVVDDIAEARAAAADAGLAIEQEIFLDGGEAIYIDTGGGPGTMVEVLEAMPGFNDLCAMMRDTHKTWDGSDPVRDLG